MARKQIRVRVGLIGIAVLVCGIGAGTAMAQKNRNAQGGASSNEVTAAAASDGEYRVGPGDVLDINVWKEPEASAPAIVVRPDGKISLPLVHDIVVTEKTPMEIQAMLAEKLEPYIKSASVTVTVKEIRSKKVYVLGQVGHPGAYDIAQPKNILQILTEAGGPQPFAKQKSIYVLRNEGGKQQKLAFNYKEVVKGKKIDQNILLQPGDTVVVP